MNIIPPIPSNITFNTGTVNNEAARRDNTLKETIPSTNQNEKSGAEKGPASEFDRAKTPGQAPPSLTYEKPQVGQSQLFDGQQGGQNKDNASEQSAGREDAENRQKEQQQADEAQVKELKQRDSEVRAHEQAHAAIGGQHAASPKYEYETGPDGRQYAVGGEVSINISSGATPEETVRKMQQVQAAALAPAQPSAQDLRVASEAAQRSVEARNDIAQEKAEQAKQALEQGRTAQQSSNVNEQSPKLNPQVPSVDETANGIDISAPTRSLEDGIEFLGTNSSEEAIMAQQMKLFYENRDEKMVRRLAIIDSFYQQSTVPKEQGFRQTA
ncbi:putative metalloprotease CJM1_0395 family protein [Paraglaciecola sp. 25GB23A]|uniref:putative metalloprotease CJM1_0395 family protein n=1 Tax=Paraglaciecola sp. 25GB23A TaxID=3156068 RepID=UPI0032AEF002